jgi:putative FmdB family regulatory protein
MTAFLTFTSRPSPAGAEVYAARRNPGKSSDVGSPFGPGFPERRAAKRRAGRRYTRLAMPTYEYVCKSCGHLFEIVQSMRDEALTQCPECGGELRKVFAPPAISFKGSGFYATDHGKRATTATGEKGEKTDKGESKKETSSDGTKDSKKEATSKASSSPKASPSASGTSPSGTEGGGS